MRFSDKYGFITYDLIKTTKRLTFDIIHQSEDITFDGDDDGDYFMFIASNGYQVISRSRMDIQTERIWLLGGANDETANRSGTMIFSSDQKRDLAFNNFVIAIEEFIQYNYKNGQNKRLSDYT